jgi:hypothetical protein
MMALITPFPSSLFPVRVALKAVIASSNEYLYVDEKQREKIQANDKPVCN